MFEIWKHAPNNCKCLLNIIFVNIHENKWILVVLSLSEQKAIDFIRVQLKLPFESSLASSFHSLFPFKNHVGIFVSRRYLILGARHPFSIWKTMLNVALKMFYAIGKCFKWFRMILSLYIVERKTKNAT